MAFSHLSYLLFCYSLSLGRENGVVFECTLEHSVRINDVFLRNSFVELGISVWSFFQRDDLTVHVLLWRRGEEGEEEEDR